MGSWEPLAVKFGYNTQARGCPHQLGKMETSHVKTWKFSARLYRATIIVACSVGGLPATQ